MNIQAMELLNPAKRIEMEKFKKKKKKKIDFLTNIFPMKVFSYKPTLHEKIAKEKQTGGKKNDLEQTLVTQNNKFPSIRPSPTRFNIGLRCFPVLTNPKSVSASIGELKAVL